MLFLYVYLFGSKSRRGRVVSPLPPATPIPSALILGRRKLPSKQQVDGVLKDKFIKSQLDLMGTCNGL